MSLLPWLRFHETKSYVSIDLPAAEYTPLTPEALLFDATLGAAPPEDRTLKLPTIASGVANAVVWTWEVSGRMRSSSVPCDLPCDRRRCLA